MAEIGTTLKEARLERGLSIDEVARATRVSSRFLLALEDDDFDELPAPVYVRGFLRLYAGQLGLDPDELIEQLPEGLGTAAASPAPAVSAVEDVSWEDEDALAPRADIERPPPPPIIDDMAPAAHPPLPRSGPSHESDAGTAVGLIDTLRLAIAQVVHGAQEPAAEAGGILLERQPRQRRLTRSPKLLAIAGGGVGGVVLLVAGVAAMGGGGGGRFEGLLPNGGPTQGPRTETVIPVGSPTSEASPSPEATPSPTETATPEPTATFVPPPPAPTSTPVPPTPTPAPTSTPVPPTPADTPSESPTPTVTDTPSP